MIEAREGRALCPEAGVGAVWPRLSEQTAAHHHEVRLLASERRVVHPEAFHRPRREVLRDDVRPEKLSPLQFIELWHILND